MKDYHDLMCCPKCGNIDILEASSWTYVNDTTDKVESKTYKCPDCGVVDKPVKLSFFVEDQVEEMLKKEEIFIYEQPCGAIYCAFIDYPLLRYIYNSCDELLEFYRLYDDGSEGLVEDNEDLEESIDQRQTIGFEIEVPANRPRYCIPAIAEKIYPYFIS